MSSRATKIVATIGPASEEKEPLDKCVAAGMNVMRINFSHATVDEFHLRKNNLRSNPAGENVAIMLDTKGPEIRMGGLKVCKETGDRKAKISLTEGSTLQLTTDTAYNGASDASTLYVDYDRIGEVVSPGDKVLLDDGLVILEVTEVVRTGGPEGALVTTRVTNTSDIGERKGVNLPGVKTGLPAMSDKDKVDIKFGIEHDIDMVAASFVRSASGVHEIRAFLRQCLDEVAAEDPSRMGEPLPLIISKIESTEALDELPSIVAASDGIMVARGDLGVEVPIETVITYQKEMVEMCQSAGKPVVVATQMLESMQKNPRPTRAEVADVTNAVLDGADAVMLSGESANGKYPSESIAMQASICEHAEDWAFSRGLGEGGLLGAGGEHMPFVPMPGTDFDVDGPGKADAESADYEVEPPLDEQDFEDAEDRQHVAAAAAMLAERVDAAAIVVFDYGLTGPLARALAKGRPSMPIAALCASKKDCRQLAISRGVLPVYVDEEGLSRLSDDGDFPDAFEAVALVCEKTDLLPIEEKVVCVIGDAISVQHIDEQFYEMDEDEE